MQMRPHLQLLAVIKAMTEDVIPALDPANQLAMQSAQLTVGTLALICRHLPLEFRYSCDELSRLVVTAGTLRDRLEGGSQTATARACLVAAIGVAADVLERARAEPAEISDAIRSLRGATSLSVSAAYVEGTDTVVADVEKIVLTAAREQLLRDRSWLLLQGWEPDPASIPSIEELLQTGITVKPA
jgi:hypothetical protein